MKAIRSVPIFIEALERWRQFAFEWLQCDFGSFEGFIQYLIVTCIDAFSSRSQLLSE
jgi:hypothetical protein